MVKSAVFAGTKPLAKTPSLCDDRRVAADAASACAALSPSTAFRRLLLRDGPRAVPAMVLRLKARAAAAGEASVGEDAVQAGSPL